MGIISISSDFMIAGFFFHTNKANALDQFWGWVSKSGMQIRQTEACNPIEMEDVYKSRNLHSG
jgi:hypothetical protein